MEKRVILSHVTSFLAHLEILQGSGLTIGVCSSIDNAWINSGRAYVMSSDGMIYSQLIGRRYRRGLTSASARIVATGNFACRSCKA